MGVCGCVNVYMCVRVSVCLWLCIGSLPLCVCASVCPLSRRLCVCVVAVQQFSFSVCLCVGVSVCRCVGISVCLSLLKKSTIFCEALSQKRPSKK